MTCRSWRSAKRRAAFACVAAVVLFQGRAFGASVDLPDPPTVPAEAEVLSPGLNSRCEQIQAEKKALLAELREYNRKTAFPVPDEQAAYFRSWQKRLVARSSVYLAGVNQLKNDVAEALSPLNDPVFAAAALESAKKDIKLCYDAFSDAVLGTLFGPENDAADRAADRAYAQLERAEEAYRELRTKNQELHQAQVTADIQAIRKDPILAAELEQVLRRIHDEERDRLRLLDEIGDPTIQMRLELKRLRDSGAYRDTADLLAHAPTDPKVRAALDHAREAAMHNQSDVLRDSIDEINAEVERLKRRLPTPAPGR